MKLFKGIKIFDHSLYVKDYLRSKNLVGHNDIINGGLRFWQRGTSFASIPHATYNADRFRYTKNGTMVHDITRDTDIPNSDISYSLKIDCTTADSDIDAGNYCQLYQAIEGYNFKKYVGNYGVLSFWVKATKIGTYCVGFRNSISDRSYVAEYTVNVTDTWEYKIIVIPFDYSDGTWDYANGAGLYINWTFASGSTYQTTPDAWQTGNYIATFNQVNACDSTDNNIFLAGVKFELGKIATPFIPNDYESELVRSMRYYHRKNAESAYIRYGQGVGNGNGGAYIYVQFPVIMRTAPSLSYSGNLIVFDGTANTSVTNMSVDQSSSHCIDLSVTASSSLTAGQLYQLTSDNNITSYIAFDAEL